MPTIRLETSIAASPERCFDLSYAVAPYSWRMALRSCGDWQRVEATNYHTSVRRGISHRRDRDRRHRDDEGAVPAVGRHPRPHTGAKLSSPPDGCIRLIQRSRAFRNLEVG